MDSPRGDGEAPVVGIGVTCCLREGVATGLGLGRLVKSSRSEGVAFGVGVADCVGDGRSTPPWAADAVVIKSGQSRNDCVRLIGDGDGDGDARADGDANVLTWTVSMPFLVHELPPSELLTTIPWLPTAQTLVEFLRA